MYNSEMDLKSQDTEPELLRRGEERRGEERSVINVVIIYYRVSQSVSQSVSQ